MNQTRVDMRIAKRSKTTEIQHNHYFSIFWKIILHYKPIPNSQQRKVYNDSNSVRERAVYNDDLTHNFYWF